MTVASEVNRSGPYHGNGATTVFDYDFRIVDEAHLLVIRSDVNGVETTLTLATDYTVSGVGSDSGSITTTAVPTSLQYITILRDLPFTQEVDLENQGPYLAQTVEDALDLAAMRDQQLAEEISRAVKVPASSDGDPAQLSAELAQSIIDLAGVIGDVSTVAGIASQIDIVSDLSDEIIVLSENADVISDNASALYAVEDVFYGDGVQTMFTLSRAPTSKENVDLFIGGSIQTSSDFGLVGTTLTIIPAIGDGIEIIAKTKVYMTANSIEELRDDILTAAQELAALAQSMQPVETIPFYVPIGETHVEIIGGYPVGAVANVYMNGVRQTEWSATDGLNVTFPAITIVPDGETTALVQVDIGMLNVGISALDARYQKKREGLVSPFDFGGRGRGNPDDAEIDTYAMKMAMAAALAYAEDDYAVIDMEGGNWAWKDGGWAGHASDENRYSSVIPSGKTVAFTGLNWGILSAAKNRHEYFTPFFTEPGSKVVVQGCEFDYAYLPWTQGVCLSKTATSARFEIDIETCGTPQWDVINRLSRYNPDTKVFSDTVLEEADNTGPLYRPFTEVSPGIYDLDFSDTSETAALANVVIGATYVLIHKVRGYYFIEPTDGSVEIRDCSVRAVAGMAVAGSRVVDVDIDGFDCSPRSGSKRIIVATSDMSHYNGVLGKFWQRNFHYSGCSDDWININTPASNVTAFNAGARTITFGLIAPSTVPAVGARVIGVNEVGGHVDLGKVASVSGLVVTMVDALPVGFSTNWKVIDETYICSPIIQNGRVQNCVGGGVVRGYAPIVENVDFQDINSGAISIIAFWAVYNEGPVVQEPLIDVTGRRCALAPANVIAAVQIYATMVISPWSVAPGGAIIGGRIRAHMRDCPGRAVYLGGVLGAYVEMSDLGCATAVWPALPNTDAAFYAQNCSRVNLFYINNGGNAAKAVFKASDNCDFMKLGNVTRVDVA